MDSLSKTYFDEFIKKSVTIVHISSYFDEPISPPLLSANVI